MARVTEIDVVGVEKCSDDCDMKVRETLYVSLSPWGDTAHNLYVCETCGHSEQRKGMFKHGVYDKRYQDRKEYE